MRIAALVMWLGTAGAGLYLLTAWLWRTGVRGQPAKITRHPALLLFSHPVMAVTGLALWLGYLATGVTGFAWAAFAVLCAVALLGFVMLTRWLTGRGGRHARQGRPFPAGAVLLHGTAGLATFVLVLITTMIVSRA